MFDLFERIPWQGWLLFIFIPLSIVSFIDKQIVLKKLKLKPKNKTNSLVIISADYGAGEKRIDLIDQVESKIKNDTINIHIPIDLNIGKKYLYGTPKTLQVKYGFLSNIKYIEVPENKYLEIPFKPKNESTT